MHASAATPYDSSDDAVGPVERPGRVVAFARDLPPGEHLPRLMPDRQGLEAHLAAALRECSPGRWVAIGCCEIRMIKNVNERLGHAAGEQLLEVMAGRLRRHVRSRYLVAQLNWDEFAVVIPGIRRQWSSQTLIAELRESVEAPADIAGNSLKPEIAVGVHVADRSQDPTLHTARVALRLAVGDMYRSARACDRKHR